MRTVLYSLRDLNGSTILSIDLSSLIISETTSKLTINLPSGVTTLNKFDYLNREIIFTDEKLFFLICSKQVKREWAFKALLSHAVKKVDQRIDNLNSARQRYLNELAA